MESFKCPVCGNDDVSSIGFFKEKPYCRKCISFKGQLAEKDFDINTNAKLYLSYAISDEQKMLSDKLIDNYKNGIDTLVYAVTGAGKTEICLGLIQYCLFQSLKVGFAIPRRTICYELSTRFRNLFRDNSVISVFGGHHKKLQADIVCLTTHQLFRYENYFDLLIMDEIDAFPYKGNKTLEQLFYRAIRGHYVLLTATPTDELKKEYQKPGKDLLELFVRFHHHPLPVPTLILGGFVKIHYKLLFLLRHYFRTNKPVLIFVPTIKLSRYLYLFLSLFFKHGAYINSKREDNEEIVDDFRIGKYRYLVTTAVLERGVTIKDLQVIIFRADHTIYDKYSLIQIAGRAGRKKDAPEGEVTYIGKRKTKAMEESIIEIENANKELQNMLQKVQD